MIGTRNRSAGFASRGEVLCTIKRKKTKRILRGWTRLSLFAAQLFQFCSSILSQHLRWLPLWWRGTLQVRQSGRYGFLRVVAREDGREEDTATDSAQQVAPLPWAFLSLGFALVSLSLSLSLSSLHSLFLPSHLLLVQPFDAAFARQLSPPSLMSTSFLPTLLSLAFPSA